MSSTNWLVSSAGRRGHLVRILREAGALLGGGTVVAVDCSSLSSAGLLADEFELVPRADDPAFVERMLDVCRRHRITHVVPTIDPELAVLAAATDRFAAAGSTVWVSSPEVVGLGSDKWLFHDWLTRHGFASPTTFEVRDERAGQLVGPVVAKPRGGSSSVGLVRSERCDPAMLASLPDDYIVQGEVPGYEVTVDFGVDRRGALVGMGARRRLAVRAGEVAKAVTVELPALRSAVEQFVDTLPGAFGVLNVQVFVDDSTGSVTFLELNPRFGGGFPLTWQAGGRFPLLVAGAGGPVPADARPDLVMLRYDDAVFAEADRFPDLTT
ncbi:carbamoyl-phosphate synthase large subunit [Jatrophihabitans endophyticus]|uniref:Carbamoyl-phosphate synthase large subunit n=1 Tax=Jatrophihabitans endophyticus TaxID=1206085 RepID=A0A1M5IMW6_9ACTN|nr:ATP-grasp domain-containing protein [Jatrophihabitans endophyticus]SHG29575.1 carbamoyl-phosphate synthase large subunit [Jatrophihabitans endophyticus]